MSVVVKAMAVSVARTGDVARSRPPMRSVAVVAGIATPGRARKAMSEPGTFSPGGYAAVIGWFASTGQRRTLIS